MLTEQDILDIGFKKVKDDSETDRYYIGESPSNRNITLFDKGEGKFDIWEVEDIGVSVSLPIQDKQINNRRELELILKQLNES